MAYSFANAVFIVAFTVTLFYIIFWLSLLAYGVETPGECND